MSLSRFHSRRSRGSADKSTDPNWSNWKVYCCFPLRTATVRSSRAITVPARETSKLVITFDGPLNPGPAQDDTANYQGHQCGRTRSW